MTDERTDIGDCRLAFADGKGQSAYYNLIGIKIVKSTHLQNYQVFIIFPNNPFNFQGSVTM